MKYLFAILMIGLVLLMLSPKQAPALEVPQCVVIEPVKAGIQPEPIQIDPVKIKEPTLGPPITIPHPPRDVSPM